MLLGIYPLYHSSYQPACILCILFYSPGEDNFKNNPIYRFRVAKTFFEKIHTKIRTFSEQFRTIRTFFGGKSVQSVHFFEKLRTICVHLKRIRTNRTF